MIKQYIKRLCCIIINNLQIRVYKSKNCRFKVQDGQLPEYTSDPVGRPFPDLISVSSAAAAAGYPGVQIGK